VRETTATLVNDSLPSGNEMRSLFHITVTLMHYAEIMTPSTFSIPDGKNTLASRIDYGPLWTDFSINGWMDRDKSQKYRTSDLAISTILTIFGNKKRSRCCS